MVVALDQNCRPHLRHPPQQGQQPLQLGAEMRPERKISAVDASEQHLAFPHARVERPWVEPCWRYARKMQGGSSGTADPNTGHRPGPRRSPKRRHVASADQAGEGLQEHD